EQQRLRERRGVRRVDGDHPDTARPKVGEQLAERRQVEHVAQTLAGGLEQDRERRVPGRGLQEVRGALALLPERRAPTRPTAGEQERSRGGLAKDRGEERGRRELPKYQRLDLVGVEREVLERHALLGLGEADHDAIVA